MIPLLLQKVQAKGYRIFTSGLYNVNIIGIRRTTKPNTFDDTIAVVYKDSQGWVTREFAATTDPGTYWLNKPMNVKGTAALVPGQYKSWMIDKHRGQYEALCQRIGKVKVYRDNDKDNTFDWDAFDKEHEGWYGINIHRASAKRVAGEVDKFSAGCQVIQDPQEFSSFMQIIQMSADIYGNAFTYTLLEEKDV
jgi:hypothetical protein